LGTLGRGAAVTNAVDAAIAAVRNHVFEPIAQRSGLVGECHGVASEIHQPVAPLAHDVDGVLNVAAHCLTPTVSMWAAASAAGVEHGGGADSVHPERGGRNELFSRLPSLVGSLQRLVWLQVSHRKNAVPMLGSIPLMIH